MCGFYSSVLFICFLILWRCRALYNPVDVGATPAGNGIVPSSITPKLLSSGSVVSPKLLRVGSSGIGIATYRMISVLNLWFGPAPSLASLRVSSLAGKEYYLCVLWLCFVVDTI